MTFIQPTAPHGWTRVTANDDALPRIVGSTVPGTGHQRVRRRRDLGLMPMKEAAT
jgi:hypothetical protein